jgi:hypothetical protein
LSAPARFQPSGIGGGGYFGPAAIDPADHNDIFLPTDMGELFHSTDGGATWTYPPLSQISAFYRSPVQFTGNPDVMWAINAATGHPSESADGGNAWSDSPSWNSSTGPAIFLYTDPTRASNFIVCSTSDGSGTNNAVYLSKDGGATWGSPVYVANPGTGSSGQALQLVVSGLFKDGNNVWIPTSQGILYSSDDGGSFGMLAVPWNSSTEAPSSVAISRAGDTIRFVATTVAPDALTANDDFAWSPSAKNVYLSDFTVSTNTQGAWTNITSRLPADKLEGFAAMAQGNINTIYLAGEDTNDYGVPSVLKSTDGGSTWTETFQYVNNANIATDQFGYDGSEFGYSWCGYAMSLEICPNNVNQVIITNLGTAWMTSDGGAGGANTTASNADWKDITVAPAYLHNPGTVAPAGTTPYAGTADNVACYNVIYLGPTDLFAAMTDMTGVYSTDGGQTWYFPTYNPGAYFSNFYAVTEDYRTGVLFAAAGSHNNLFKAWPLDNASRDGTGGGLDYSTDGGKTWSLLSQWSNPNGSTNPLTDVVIDPSTPGRAYALVANSTNGAIWRTDNLYLADGRTINPSPTWTRLAVPSRYLAAFTYGPGYQAYAAGTYSCNDPNDLKVLNDGTLVAVFDAQFDPTDNHINPSSGVWVSTDGGSTWTDRSDLNLSQSNMMFFSQKITIDPQDPTQDTWYVATDYTWEDVGRDNYGVFETTDRGAHWTQIFTGDTPDGTGLGCDNVSVDADTGEMYLSTSTGGVYFSASKSNFTKLNQVPYTTIDNVVIDPYRTSQVWACAHGNGLWEGDSDASLPSNLTLGGASGHQFALNWSPVGGATGYEVQYTNGAVNWTGVVTWTTYASLPAGSSSTDIDGLPADSAYDFRVVPLNGATAIGSSNLVTGLIPGAPTGLTAAGSGPSEIELQWGGDQRFNTSYDLQYSLDGVTWQDLSTIHSPTATTDSVGGLQPDTQYWFRLVALSATDESAPSNVAVARTLNANGLLAYEGFNYAPTPRDEEVLGQTGGFGWSGGWSSESTDGSRDALSGSLVATDSTVSANLLTTGNRFEAANYGEIDRNLAAPTSNAPGTTLWLSVLVTTHNTLPVGEVQLVDTIGSGSKVSVGFPPGNNNDYGVFIDGINGWSTGTRPAVGETHLLVMEISYGSSPNGDSIQMWIDPDPTAASPGAPVLNENAGVALPAFNRVNLVGAWWGGIENDWDELRLGTSYAAVVPRTLPTPPAGLTATAVGSGGPHINLQWTNTAAGATGIHVERSTDQRTWSLVQTLGASATTWTDSGVGAGTTYYYRVSSYNATGDSLYSNSATVAVDGGPTRTALSSDHPLPTGSVYGQTVVFTATVTPDSGTFDDGGTVQFAIDGSNYGAPVPLAGGGATIQVSALTTGTHSVTATYSGDTLFGGSGATLGGGQTVTRATPSLDASAHGGIYDGHSFPASLTIRGIDGLPAASLEDVTPALTYYVGSDTTGASLGSAPPVHAGTYTAVASFGGSADYAPIRSAPATFTIGRASATIALTSSGGSAVYGQPVTFVATVDTTVSPGGTVTFSDGATPLATIAPDSFGKVTFTTSSLAAGSHSITATYSGATDVDGARSGAVAETVDQAAAEIVVALHPAYKGKKLQAVGMTAEIEPLAPGGGTPTGRVTFEYLVKQRRKTKMTTLGTVAVSGGRATLTFKPQKILNKSLTIAYSGDTSFQAASTTLPELTRRSMH